MATENEDTRRRLLEAAGAVFAAKGLDAPGVREIALKAGTNPAAVNYYFRSKEQLYVEAVRYAAEMCLARSPLPVFGPDTLPEEKLRGFIRAFLGRFLREDVPDWQGQLILREVAQPTEACATFVEEFVRPTFNALLAILKELVPAGVGPMKLNLLGGSIIGQCLHYHHARFILPLLVGAQEYARYDLDRVAEHVWGFSLAALRGLYPGGKEGGQ